MRTTSGGGTPLHQDGSLPSRDASKGNDFYIGYGDRKLSARRGPIANRVKRNINEINKELFFKFVTIERGQVVVEKLISNCNNNIY